MTKAPKRGPGRPPENPEPSQWDVCPPFTYFVEGTGTVGIRDPEKRKKVYALEKLVAEVGLHLHVTFLKKGEDPSDPRKARRRFSTRVVTMGDLIAHVSDHPGLTLDELTDDVHRVEPWTDQAKAAARHRLQVSLNVLRRREPNAVRVEYDPQGRRRYHPGEDAKRLIASMP